MLQRSGPGVEYREPFFGSGAVGLSLLERNPKIRHAWINERDPSAAALWDCVLHRERSLKLLVHLFREVLDADYFYFFKRVLLSVSDPGDLTRYDSCWVGLVKLVAHQLSYSGLGACSGGPIGGREQRGPYGVGSRYNPVRIGRAITKCHDILSRVQLRHGGCSCLDFEALCAPGDALTYYDPPYFVAGPGLYQFSFGLADHERLCSLLRRDTRPWLLSYDLHPTILDLYQGWSKVEEIPVGYSINGHVKKTELLISNWPVSMGGEHVAVNTAVATQVEQEQTVPASPAESGPGESWGLDQLGRYASWSIAESISLARKSAAEVRRAGHALSIAKGKLEDRRRWGVWLAEHGIARTSAWEAIELYRRTGSEQEIAERSVSSAKELLGITSPRARVPPPAPDAAPGSRRSKGSRPGTRTTLSGRRVDENKDPIRAISPRPGAEEVDEPGRRSDGGTEREGDDGHAPPRGANQAIPGEPAAPPTEFAPPPPKEDPDSALSVLARIVARLGYLCEALDTVDWSGGGAGEALALAENGIGLFQRIGEAIRGTRDNETR